LAQEVWLIDVSLTNCQCDEAKRAGPASSQGLPGMGPIGPAAGPATSRRFLLGPIGPMPVTRSTDLPAAL